MNVLLNIILAVQMLSAVVMVGLILIQHGKGADMGAAFGSGGSGSLFGASGSANFLSRTTAVLAAVFFVCTLMLAYFGNLRPVNSGTGSVLEGAAVNQPAGVASSPAAPAALIPGGTTNNGVTAPSKAVPAAPAVAASGAGQIPTK